MIYASQQWPRCISPSSLSFALREALNECHADIKAVTILPYLRAHPAIRTSHPSIPMPELKIDGKREIDLSLIQILNVTTEPSAGTDP